MKAENEPKATTVLPVRRTKEEAKQFYDRISRVYDYFAGALERKYAEMALERLCVQEGETVLEIGFGSGHCLKRIAETVGQKGEVCGIDAEFVITSQNLARERIWAATQALLEQ